MNFSKDFDKWNSLKKDLCKVNRKIFVHEREIWWTSLGLNIGAEVDGKNNNFERPVLIIKVYNKETLLALPLTAKVKKDRFHIKILLNQKPAWVKLSQVRVLSTKRLLRKMGMLDKYMYDSVLRIWKSSI